MASRNVTPATRLSRKDSTLLALGAAAGLFVSVLWGYMVSPRSGGAGLLHLNRDTLCAGVEKPATHNIPKILHHVYLSGRSDFESFRNSPDSMLRPEWADWCRAVHHDWTHMFWDAVTAEQLLKEKYPWFLPTWRRYDKIVYKGDAIRYFIMHAYGGLYMDLDVECFREGYDMLAGADVVVQGTYMAEEGVTNAILASAPGHPFWERTFPVMMERVGEHPIKATGPAIVRDTILSFGLSGVGMTVPDGRNTYVGSHAWNGTAIQVHRLGSWFTPCWATDRGCHKKLAGDRLAGVYKADVVGYHHFTGTWNHPGDERARLYGLSYADIARQFVCSVPTNYSNVVGNRGI